MDKLILPLMEPGYSTYHGQAAAGAILTENPSVWNFYINRAVNLRCNTKFLEGYSTPDLGVDRSDFTECPAIDKRMIEMEFIGKYTEQVSMSSSEEWMITIWTARPGFVKGISTIMVLFTGTILRTNRSWYTLMISNGNSVHSKSR